MPICTLFLFILGNDYYISFVTSRVCTCHFISILYSVTLTSHEPRLIFSSALVAGFSEFVYLCNCCRMCTCVLCLIAQQCAKHSLFPPVIFAFLKIKLPFPQDQYKKTIHITLAYASCLVFYSKIGMICLSCYFFDFIFDNCYQFLCLSMVLT